jgi:phage tail-like protein
MPETAQTPPPTPESGAQPGVFNDPFRAYNFKLIIQGVAEAHFTECSNIAIKVHTIPYREGGQQQVVHQIPARVEYANVTLRYGLTASRELWDWFMSAVQGRVQRKNVSIAMLNSEGTLEVLRWNLMNCWPMEWRGAPLDAMGNDVAIETLVLVFDSLERG